MPLIGSRVASPDLGVLFGTGTLGDLGDGQLLHRFATCRDESGELAFAELLDRHGPMVLRVCRRLLRDPSDAEDAFQATFVVLARKARTLWVRESLGPWLHGVAYRIARRSLSDRARRQRHERRAAGLAPAESDPVEPDDLGPVLHEEIGQLPERIRAAIVLCYLEGLTHDQAAHRLGWPVGTVRSRLARGRDRLRARLDERGVAPALALLTAVPKGRAVVAIRPSLVVATVRTARSATTTIGMAAAGTGPAVEALSTGVLRMMMWKSLFKSAAAVVAAGLLVTGVGAVALQAADSESKPAPGSETRVAQAAPAAEAPKSEAQKIAEKILKAGSDLFDAKNAAALAATYTEDGEVIMVGKKDDQINYDYKQGRNEIEAFYRDHFQRADTIDSENTVEYARLISGDLLVIHGKFRPNTNEAELPFVQLRVKQGDRWLLSKLWLFLNPGA